jgi:WD40 repeat protein
MAIDPRVSPNGDLLAFEAFEEGVTQVAVMKPETGNWSILTHDRTRGTLSFLSWAPDGSSIYYMRNVPEAVYRVPVLGGEERLILENAGPADARPDVSLRDAKLNELRQPQLHRYWPDSGRLQELPLLMPGKFNATFGFRPTADGKQIVAFGTLVGHELEGHRLRVIDLATGASTTLASAPLSIGLAGGAVSHDGKSLLLAMPSGSLTRIVSIPTQGRSSPRTLFTVANNVWYLDAARDGSVYASVMDRPVEIVRRTLDGSRSEPVARFPMQAPPDIVAVLPDGRAVTEQILAGKSRIVAAERNKDPQPLVATSDETSTPLTVVPPRQIGFMIGAAPRRTIALADTSTGRITSRIETNKGDVDSLAASPDGRRLFFAAGGAVWSVASSGGEVQRVRSGDHVVMDPSGRYLIVSAIEDNTFRFFRVFVDGRPEEQITTDGSLPIMNYPSSPGALAADGRLLVPLVDAWFNRPAVLDTTTGRITKLPSDDVSDYHSMAWLPDGRIMALHVGLRSTLWRFRPNR